MESSRPDEQDRRRDPPRRPAGRNLEDISGRISREIAEIHERSYGRAPNDVKTHLLDDAVLCIVEMDLMPHEQIIVDAGGDDSVREVRSAFQEAIGATFIAAVEHMTGRRVVGFLSDMHVDPAFEIEFFKLGPVAEHQ